MCPDVSSGCIALRLGMPGMPAVTSGYHTAFIPSAHKYRDRDTDRSYPLAESRDEIGQRLLLNRTKLKQNTGGNKTRLSFLKRRATGDVKNHPRADCSCLRLTDFAESMRDLLSVLVASDPLQATQRQNRLPGPVGFPPTPRDRCAWRNSTGLGLGRSSEKIQLSNPILFPSGVFRDVPSTSHPSFFHFLTSPRPLAALCPEPALQGLSRAPGTRSWLSFAASLPPRQHSICPFPRLTVQESTWAQKKETSQHKSRCKNAEISSLRIRVRGLDYYYYYHHFFF